MSRSIQAALVFFAAFLSFAPGSGGTALAAQDTVGAFMSRDSGGILEWQRIRLEDRIQERIRQAVAPTVPKNQFVVNVKVDLKPRPPAPVVVPKVKKPTQAELEREKKKRELAALKNSPGASDDRITLSKLDLDAPLFPEEAALAKADEDADAQDEDEVEAPIAEPDLFASIAKVSIGVLFDKSMPDSKKDIILRIVTSSVGNFGDVAPEITVDKVDLLPPAPPEKKFEFPPERPEKPWDMKRWLVEFKTTIGMFLASVIFAGLMTFIAVFLFFGYRSLEGRKIALMEAKNAREEATAQEAAQNAQEGRERSDSGMDEDVGGATQVSMEHHGSSAGTSTSSNGGGSGTGGFDKFKALLKDSPERAAILIKQWSKAPGRGAGDALGVLPAVLTTEEFVQIFKFLGPDDRKAWKKVLSSRVETPDSAAAEAFIASQIVDNFLVTLPVMDEELKAQLGDLTTEEAAELSTADPNIGAMLATLLPTNQVSNMYSRLPADRANAVTLASLRLSDEDIRKGFAMLKASIARVKGRKTRIPFLDKAVELLADIEPDKEPVIFNAIAESQDWSLLETAARLFFPSELIPRLPDRVLKACLDQLPLIKRAELIASLDDETRDHFINAVGKEGSKARELIDVEVQELFADDIKKRRVTKNREAIWRSFSDTVRSSIRSSENISDMVGPVVDAWLSEKSGGRIGGVDESQNAA